MEAWRGGHVWREGLRRPGVEMKMLSGPHSWSLSAMYAVHEHNLELVRGSPVIIPPRSDMQHSDTDLLRHTKLERGRRKKLIRRRDPLHGRHCWMHAACCRTDGWCGGCV